MTQPTPLSRWMQAVKPGAIVAYRNEQPVTSDDVLTKVDAWRTALQHTNGTHFAVYLDDTVEFLAVLFALWSLERVACVWATTASPPRKNSRLALAVLWVIFPNR